MRNLQDQIEELQAEVLQVRRENSRLHDRVKRMQKESARLRNDAAREALANILDAVPALSQLKQSLDALAPHKPITRPNGQLTERTFINPMATRPAASAAETVGLGILDEELEPSDSPMRRRKSSPFKQFPVLKKSAYSSPKRSPKRTPPRKRRRESGLLPRPASPDSDSSLSSPEPEPAAELEPTPEAEESTWDEGSSVLEYRPAPLIEDSGAVTPTPSNRLGVKVKDIAAHLASIDIDRESERATPEAETALALALELEAGADLADLGASASSRESEPIEEEGGRSRRTRSSVSYKEPSLRKKMRKPDGVGVEDVLGGSASGGGKRILDTGVRRKSALPRSAAKIGLNDEQLDLLSTSSSSTTRAKSRSVTPRAITPTTSPPSTSPRSSPGAKTKRDALGELSSNTIPAPAPAPVRGKRVSTADKPAEPVPRRAGRRSAAIASHV